MTRATRCWAWVTLKSVRRVSRATFIMKRTLASCCFLSKVVLISDGFFEEKRCFPGCLLSSARILLLIGGGLAVGGEADFFDEFPFFAWIKVASDLAIFFVQVSPSSRLHWSSVSRPQVIIGPSLLRTAKPRFGSVVCVPQIRK